MRYTWFKVLAFGLALMASPSPGRSEEATLSLQLDEPREKPLTGPEMLQIFSGKRLVVDQDYRPAPDVRVNQKFMGGCPPVEIFSAGNQWAKYECQATPRFFDGRWFTEEYQLCVEAEDYPKECRFVWRGPRSDHVILTVPKFIYDRRIKIFTLYRLEIPEK